MVTLVKKHDTARYTTDDSIAPRTRVACWIITAADTNSEYVMFIFSPRQKMVKRTHTDVAFYIYCLSFYK